MSKKLYIKGTRPLWGFSKNAHPFPIISWLIRLLTWSKISHVVWDLPDSDMVFHTYFNSRKFENRKPYLDSTKIVYNFEVIMCDLDYKMLMADFTARQGEQEGYYLSLFGIALTLPLRWLGFKVKNPARWFYPDCTTCSEMMAIQFKETLQSRILRSINQHVSMVTEQDIINALEKETGKYGRFLVTKIPT